MVKGNDIFPVLSNSVANEINSCVVKLVPKYNSLSSARFMKTIRGRHKDGAVVVKIFIKPEPEIANIVRALEGGNVGNGPL